MFITGLGTQTPPAQYTQSQCWDALSSEPVFLNLSAPAKALLERVLLGNNGIDTRFLAVDSLREVFDLRPDALHERFSRHAPAMATEAARKALAKAQVSPNQIQGVIVSTCTGYLCPGLSSYVIENLGLDSAVLALDLVGQGCGAALPNLRTGHALIQSGQCDHVLSICVEVCSAAMYLDEDPGVLISACLFGDAAGAAVLSSKVVQSVPRVVRWLGSTSLTNPADRELLRFETRGGMLRNVLSKRVPLVAARAAEEALHRLGKLTGIKREQIMTWILHAGGRDVLNALRERMGLQESDMAWSAEILATCGNISSPFVYHVLEHALNQGAPNGHWLLSSFGAGFSCHAAFLEVFDGS